MPEEEEDTSAEGEGYEIILEPQHLAGVWANFGRVSQSEHEFTLDFVRLDNTTRKGIVVARVSVSPLFIMQLVKAIQAEWGKYERRALPKEVYADEQDNGEETGTGEPAA